MPVLSPHLQVRFGVLNAGNFGVPQSRKRTFIWAAAPEEQLPAWPTARHVFRTPQLAINLPGGVQYTAVPQLPGAPCRTVTVRDAIKDLPAIQNGDSMWVLLLEGSGVERRAAWLMVVSCAMRWLRS